MKKHNIIEKYLFISFNQIISPNISISLSSTHHLVYMATIINILQIYLLSIKNSSMRCILLLLYSSQAADFRVLFASAIKMLPAGGFQASGRCQCTQLIYLWAILTLSTQKLQPVVEQIHIYFLMLFSLIRYDYSFNKSTFLCQIFEII